MHQAVHCIQIAWDSLHAYQSGFCFASWKQPVNDEQLESFLICVILPFFTSAEEYLRLLLLRNYSDIIA